MQIFTSVFLHEDLAQSAQKSSVEQHLAYSIICPNLSWITPFLPRTLGAPSCLLRDWREMTEIHTATPIIGGIPEFQLLRIHCRPLLQYSPTPWVRPARSDISRY